MFPPHSLPARGESVLITDRLPSPADFLLHRYFATHIKESKEAKCIVIDTTDSQTKWKLLAGKSGINLPPLVASESAVFLDAIDKVIFPEGATHGESTPLRLLYDCIQSIFEKWNQRPPSSKLVIVDDLSSLEWIGLPLVDLKLFSRAIFTLCRKFNASLIIRHHIVNAQEIDDLHRHLMQLCTHYVDVLPLSTGRSGSVSGQVTLRPGPILATPSYKVITRSSAIQYRLTETGVMFFDRGTGSTVL